MTLRLLLVGVVTCLGMEPPSGQDLAGWVESGREFWLVRMLGEGDFAPTQGPGVELAARDDRPVAAPADAATRVDRDLADALFAAINDEQAATFSADRRSKIEIVADDAPDEPAVVAAEAEIEIEGQPSTAETYALADEVSTGDDQADAPGSVEAILSPEPESRTDQVAVALRLTGDALHAWANLLQSPGSASRH